MKIPKISFRRAIQKLAGLAGSNLRKSEKMLSSELCLKLHCPLEDRYLKHGYKAPSDPQPRGDTSKHSLQVMSNAGFFSTWPEVVVVLRF